MIATIKLLTVLPATLKIAWLLLLIGLVALAAGYFTHTPWQSYSGLICLIVGFVIAFLDMEHRKKRRDEASGFYVGATVAPVISVAFVAFVALLGAIVLATQSMIYGFSGSSAMRLVHFLGVLFAFLVVSGIPGLALRSRPDTKTEQDVPPNA
jgi:hypothetical protein